jgi:Flp pilus assembly pilin Flp
MPEIGETMQRLFTDESGQATAEYALVVVAAAAIAGALIVWATSTGALSALFDAVITRVSSFM